MYAVLKQHLIHFNKHTNQHDNIVDGQDGRIPYPDGRLCYFDLVPKMIFGRNPYLDLHVYGVLRQQSLGIGLGNLQRQIHGGRGRQT